MKELRKVRVIVGADSLDTMPRKYVGDASVLLDRCRRVANKHASIWVSDPNTVLAFQALHQRTEIDLTIELHQDGTVLEYPLDADGRLISPWPDSFFELQFYLLFHAKEL